MLRNKVRGFVIEITESAVNPRRRHLSLRIVSGNKHKQAKIE